MARTTGTKDTNGIGFRAIATVAVGFVAITSAAAGIMCDTCVPAIVITGIGAIKERKRLSG